MSSTKPVALVTGSSRGIGLGIAKSLAASGFNIILNAPKISHALEQAEKDIKATGADVKTLILDISKTRQHKNKLGEAFSFFGNIDCLVNNAGIGVVEKGDILDITPENFDTQIETNLRGTFFLTQAFSKIALQKPTNQFRSIITISSSNAIAASIDRSEYCIAKSAVSMMTRLFSIRLAEHGINVYEVRPGLIDTDLTRPAKAHYDKLLNNGFSPINRWGKTNEVGEAVTALAAGNMRFSTGDAIHIDGGLLINRY